MLGKKEEGDVVRPGDLNTIIGKGSVLEGTLKVDSGIRIDGKVKGDITTKESLYIGTQGEVEGEIKAKNAIIGGKVVGKIIATGKIVLESRAIFHGEMKASRLIIDDGAIFDGQCTMKNGNKVVSPPKPESGKPEQK